MKKQAEKRKHKSDSGELPLLEREKIEIVRRGRERQAVLSGVARILQYDPACMIFLRGRNKVEIHGEGLECVFFISGAVGVCGCIRKIIFVGEVFEK